jgi:hypothetical protein
MSDEEARGRAAEVARVLESLDDMGDAEEQARSLEELMRSIDAEPLSPRKRFR